MIYRQLETHWRMCRALRWGTHDQKSTATLYFRAVQSPRNPPLIKKAIRNVRLAKASQ